MAKDQKKPIDAILKHNKETGISDQKTLKKADEPTKKLESYKKLGRKPKSEDEKADFQISFYINKNELNDLKDFISTQFAEISESRMAKEILLRFLRERQK